MSQKTGWTLAAAGAVVLLSACGGGGSGGNGGSGGLASESPSQIWAAAVAATKGATNYRLAGTGDFGSGVTAFDFQVRGGDIDGTATLSGSTIDLIVLSGNVYFKAGADFWTGEGLSADEAALAAGIWVEAPAGSSYSGDFSQVSETTDISSELQNHGTLASGGTGNVDGQAVVFVKDTTNHTTLAVATSGTAYPVQYTSSGSSSYTLTASDWGGVAAFTPPPNPYTLPGS